MIPNSFFIDRKRMPQTKAGLYSDTDFLHGSLGYRTIMNLDFIGIREEDGTYTMIKNRANFKQSMTSSELLEVLQDYGALEENYKEVYKQFLAEEERKAKEGEIDFQNKPWGSRNPTKTPRSK